MSQSQGGTAAQSGSIDLLPLRAQFLGYCDTLQTLGVAQSGFSLQTVVVAIRISYTRLRLRLQDKTLELINAISCSCWNFPPDTSFVGVSHNLNLQAVIVRALDCVTVPVGTVSEEVYRKRIFEEIDGGNCVSRAVRSHQGIKDRSISLDPIVVSFQTLCQ